MPSVDVVDETFLAVAPEAVAADGRTRPRDPRRAAALAPSVQHRRSRSPQHGTGTAVTGASEELP